MVAAARPRVLLQAAPCCLAHPADEQSLRRQRVRHPSVRTVSARRRCRFCLWHRGTALRGRVGLWSALTYASLPGVSVSAFIISTDAVLLPCWAAALYAFVLAREQGGWGWWIGVGLAAGLGLLAKYAMAYWMLSALGYVLLAEGTPSCGSTPRLARPRPPIYAPNFWWNWSNGFVSYLHTRYSAALSGPLFHPDAFIEFLGAQSAVFGPLLVACLFLLSVSPRSFVEPRARLLAAFALPTLVMMLAVSFLSRAHANWAAPTYVSATVLVVAWALQRGWRRIVTVSIALHLAAAVLMFTGRETAAAVGLQLPGEYDPLRRLRGWRDLGREVGAALAAHPGLTLFADDRESSPR